MIHSIRALASRGAVAMMVVVAAQLSAQQPKPKPSAFDRRAIPNAGTTPELRVPSWTKTTLSNGAQLIVSEKHGLPLVSFQINFVGGANQYEAVGKTGLASLVASMLTEGTQYRTGDQISNELQLLGTSVSTFIGNESGRISFLSTRDKFAPTLSILSDILVHPTFPLEALDRLRSPTIVSLTQNRDRTSGIA